MISSQPDIVLVSPDGEYLMLVEIKLNDSKSQVRTGIAQLTHAMVAMGCSTGLLITGARIILLRDSLESVNGASIQKMGEARLPHELLTALERPNRQESYAEFEVRVQQWLESLKLFTDPESLPDAWGELLGGTVLGLLRLGEILVTHPRWSPVAP